MYPQSKPYDRQCQLVKHILGGAVCPFGNILIKQPEIRLRGKQ